ncbi:hypothetical protein DQ04_10731010 [Trypanosoma grayi]|uniref:hypothetical protein n=1 Tax=Trypanosoma grayi TaxID=71804 RepID=UPI0004F4002A|nr:hypothetical protein DQ04_10731010 [Trypanosoma grayi]KEG07152.1 hypothetical protein DQ04_10731010 [Trypanosoma grayi]
MAARDTVSLPNGLLPSALWEFPSEVQWDVLRQLIGALESALEVNARAPPGGDTDGLSCHERDLLAEELAWLQRQLPRIHHDTAMHERPLKLSNRISVTAQVGHRTRFDGMHTPSSSLNGISPCSLSHTDQQRGVRSEMAPQPAGMRVTSSATSTGSRTKPPPPQQLEEEQEKREAIPGGERRREALDQMMERALAARVQKGHLSPGLPADKGEALPENRGSDGAKDSWPAEPIISAVPSNAKDTDNILLRYFEGRLKDLPPFKLLPMEVMTSGGKDSNALQLLQGASTALQGPRDATRNTNSPNVMGVPTGMTLVAADAVDTATIDTASLLERLREEQRRRIEAEDALRESHQRIAALEKVTDHVSELAIHLNSAVARQLLAMQQLLRAATQSCVEITMQKSLLFSEEMTALMRQTQRHVYGVHALPPWSKAGGGPMAARAISHVPSVPLRAEEQASPAPSTARAPSYPFPTSLQLVPLKSSSCSAASPLQ